MYGVEGFPCTFPTMLFVRKCIGRLVSDDEYAANRTDLDVPPSSRNESVSQKRALISTGRLLANELRSKLSALRSWSEQLTVVFVEEAQQYGAVMVVVVTRLTHQALLVFGGDKYQTPGGLNKAAAGAERANMGYAWNPHNCNRSNWQERSARLLSKRPLLQGVATKQISSHRHGSNNNIFEQDRL